MCLTRLFKLNLLIWISLVLVVRGTKPLRIVSSYSLPGRHERAVSTCKQQGYEECLNGDCVDTYDVCDGKADCSDGSDETFGRCGNNTCPTGVFRCAYNGCVNIKSKCDGIKDCADNSDELLDECPGVNWAHDGCGKSKFRCRNGQCLNDFDSACDGIQDCEDGSDESITKCIKMDCPGFQCAYGGCINTNQKCNHIRDCFDGSDEDDLLCGRDPEPKPVNEPPPQNAHSPEPPAVISGGNDCEVPQNKGTNYIVTNDNRGTILTISCEKDYVLPTKGNTRVCFLGNWQKLVNGRIEKGDPKLECKQLCPQILDNNTISITATYFESGPPVQGSLATINCKPGYVDYTYGSNSFFQNVHSCVNGMWDPVRGYCKFGCGEELAKLGNQPLVQGGEDADVKEHPWNVGLFYDSDMTGTYIHACGGTLITPYLVLTAAHCTYFDNGKRYLPHLFRIGFGKKWIFLFDPRDSEFEQTREVVKFHDPRSEYDRNLYLSNDIVILELNSPVVLTDYVRPACIDLTKTHILKARQVGTVSGWGKDHFEGGKQPEKLQMLKLPYYSKEDCEQFVVKVNLNDKLCALHEKELHKNVREGDSGSGLIFQMNSKHYIYGIVSNMIPSRNKTINTPISLFTDVRFHLEFISTTLTSVRQKHYNMGIYY